MTQFMLVVGNQPKSTIIEFSAIEKDSGFPNRIAHQIFTEEQLRVCWYPANVAGEIVHDLFSQAQTALLEGESIYDTIIGQCLVQLFQSCQEIVLWYSSDFDDLPQYTIIEAAMNEISAQLIIESGEVFLHFIKPEV
jgi:hypothetical protein